MHPSFPQPFHYPGSTSIDPARQRGMGNTPHATANPVIHTDYPPQGSSAGRLPVPQFPLYPPAHTPAWGSGDHSPTFPTPAVHAHGIPSVPPPPTTQRMVTMPVPVYPPATMSMTGQLVNQEATPHHHLYAAQHIPQARGNPIGNRVGDYSGHDNTGQGSSEPDPPGSERVFRGDLTKPVAGNPGKKVLERLRRPRRNATEPQPAGKCRYCGGPTSRGEQLNGFCCDEHMWAAIRAGTAALCGACGDKACPPDRNVCGRCGRG
ncbi:hypothetical protein BJV78DRAFT_522320 [Lactifluus subvellereus]|nr:hypothetical protein BJV78DRAFT_522320 [Lactifluus subvellereus]